MKNISNIKHLMQSVDHDLTRVTTGANVHQMASIRQRIIAVVYNLEDACNTKEVMERFLESGDCQSQLARIVRDAVTDCKITKDESKAVRQAVTEIICALNALADTCEKIAE